VLGKVLCVLALTVVPVAAQYAPEQEPRLDPIRVMAAVMLVGWDEPRDTTNPIDFVLGYSTQTWPGEAQAQAIADQIVTQWNTAAANSDVAGLPPISRLRSCGVYLSTYTEGVGQYATDTLSWMSNKAQYGGGNEELMGVLNGRGCDLMHLQSNNQACGIGYLQATMWNPWSQSTPGCAVGNMSAIHEMGHNVGLHHEPMSACSASSCGSGWNYGHGVPAAGEAVGSASQRDPMTYPRAGGSRILWWSNPLVTISGEPFGIVNQRDNARVLRQYGPIVAGFRTRVDSTGAPVAPSSVKVMP